MPFSRNALCLALACAALLRAEAHAEQLLKIATLAPEGSGWVKAVRAIDQEVRQQTGGAVGLKIYAGGVQGDEKVVLRKIRIGQLHGGGFGGQGVSQIFADILALEMPFLFDSHEEIDYVLQKMDDFYQQGYSDNGFVFLGWADIGFVRVFSKAPVRGVKDIRGQKVWHLEDEPITEVLFRKAGVTSVPLTIPDVLLGLQTGLVDVVYASPVAAIVLQWFTRVKYITELPINYTLGALLLDQRAFSKLTPEQQDILRTISRAQMRNLTLQTRADNAEAVQVMLANGLEWVQPLPDDVQTFRDLVAQSEAELVGKAFSREAHQRVQAHLKEFRRQPKSASP